MGDHFNIFGANIFEIPCENHFLRVSNNDTTKNFLEKNIEGALIFGDHENNEG